MNQFQLDRAPETSTDQHIRRAHLALGASLEERKAVYLDTKFWILLRDAQRFPERTEAAPLLDLLCKGVASGALFCPISESVFVELMKQSDPVSRLVMASLIDQLSQGVTLVDERQRLATEITHFMSSKFGKTELHPLRHMVWSRLSFVLGVLYPTNTGLDEADERAIQKAFFDHMWSRPLADMVRVISKQNLEVPGTDLSSVATLLNTGVAAHAHELDCFRKAYSEEVRGVVDIAADEIMDVVLTMARDAGVTDPPTAAQRAESERQFRNLFILALELDKARDVLPSMHIQASLHASIRWNKGRKFKGNDLFDIHHATAALGYCDAFLTERSLAVLVTQEHVALDRLYGCAVAFDIETAAQIVRDMVPADLPLRHSP